LRLKSQNEDLQHSLQAKEAELTNLKESIQLKDQVTKVGRYTRNIMFTWSSTMVSTGTEKPADTILKMSIIMI